MPQPPARQRVSRHVQPLGDGVELALLGLGQLEGQAHVSKILRSRRLGHTPPRDDVRSADPSAHVSAHPIAGTTPVPGTTAASSIGPASSLYSTGVTNRAMNVLDTSPPMITHARGEYSADS